MGTLTKYNALVGELEPYTPSRLALQKALADVKISDWDNEYNADTDQRTIAIAAIKVLKRMIVLTNDTLGKSSQGYSVEKLERRIKDLCNENGLDVSDFVEVSSITDGSNFVVIWHGITELSDTPLCPLKQRGMKKRDFIRTMIRPCG